MHGLKRTLFAPAVVCVTALFACDGSRDPTAPSQDLQSFLNTPAGNNGSNGNGGTAEPPSQAAPKVKDKASAPAPVAEPVPAEPPVDKPKDKPKP
jgi:hypothetical protein